jgi:small subunit ribosomal protein S2
MATETTIETLFEAGAHFGYGRARRHPTATPFLFGTKDRTDIFNLDETMPRIDAAAAYAAELAAAGKQLLFVGGKHEAIAIVRSHAERIGQPYVAGRWIGGTLTNFKNIRKRIDLLEKLMAERESGELEKYTKKERLLIDRQIDELLARFGGLVKMIELPAALFVIDTRHEDTAVKEANQLGIPIIGLSSSDGNFSLIKYPIPGNDTSVKSVGLIADIIAQAYDTGKSAALKAPADKRADAQA